MNRSYEYKEDIINAVKILKEGGIILYPTDTIWGIGCDATNEAAVTKICQLKRKEEGKPMLVLLDSENRLPSYIEEVPEIAWQLIEVSDTPLTLIYPGAKNLAKNLIAPDGSIGIRISKDPFNRDLINRFRKPIVSTSANISGEQAPEIFDDINDQIKQGVNYIVKYRQDDLSRRSPSSVVKIGLSGQIQIIRK